MKFYFWTSSFYSFVFGCKNPEDHHRASYVCVVMQRLGLFAVGGIPHLVTVLEILRVFPLEKVKGDSMTSGDFKPPTKHHVRINRVCLADKKKHGNAKKGRLMKMSSPFQKGKKNQIPCEFVVAWPFFALRIFVDKKPWPNQPYRFVPSFDLPEAPHWCLSTTLVELFDGQSADGWKVPLMAESGEVFAWLTRS